MTGCQILAALFQSYSDRQEREKGKRDGPSSCVRHHPRRNHSVSHPIMSEPLMTLAACRIVHRVVILLDTGWGSNEFSDTGLKNTGSHEPGRVSSRSWLTQKGIMV